jgi:hypothetical protein
MTIAAEPHRSEPIMTHLYTYIAMQVANERSREAQDAVRARQFRANQPARPSLVRHGLASATAAVSRGSAAVTRRLDERVGDDLGRSLAPTE